MERIYALIVRGGHHPFVSCVNDDEQDLLFYDETTNAGMQWYISDKLRTADHRLRQMPNLQDTLRHRVVCLTVMDRRDVLDVLLAEILESFSGSIQPHLFENPYQTGWCWLTLHDTRATKDQAIHALAERCGLRDCSLTVFGDHLNDVTMFQTASEAVAVANAQDEVKRHATRVIGSNDDDSVVAYLVERYGRVL